LGDLLRKIIPVVVAGATALALAGGTFGYATMNKAVTLSVDGQASEVRTGAGTVGDLLHSEGIEVSDHDVVAPGLTAKLNEGSRVAVRFGREVTFNVDGKPQTIWTTATTVDQAVSALGIDTAGAELSTSRSSSIGREGLDVDIATEKQIVIKVAGKKRSFTTTAQTVGEALSEAKIAVDSDDKISIAKTAALVDGAKFSYTRVDVKRVTKKQKVAYGTVRKESGKIAKGVTKIDKAGVSGARAVTYRVVRHNGKIISRKKVGSKITRKPVTQIVLVGTKAPKTSSAPSVAAGGVWDKIAQCESGGNWSINTGNGFYGGLQFTLSTWHAYGGSGMPNQASRAQQIAVAKKVQAAQGWGAWPACTSKLGLR
jgi:uncharacterized protein YabE (DUF348 family)